MIVIGQFISALKSGKYDINKTALLMSKQGEDVELLIILFN